MSCDSCQQYPEYRDYTCGICGRKLCQYCANMTKHGGIYCNDHKGRGESNDNVNANNSRRVAMSDKGLERLLRVVLLEKTV
jgi:hypothetical protein